MTHLRLCVLVLVVLGWLLVPWSAVAYQFDPTVLNLPSQDYGISREACDGPSGTDVTLNPGTAGQAWETTLEGATPGIRYFLNAGSYTTTVLTLPNGTLGSPITIKPNNCAAVTINALIKPGSYNILAGMTLQWVPGTTNVYGGEATIGFDTGSTKTGTIIRNNMIRADDSYAIAFESATVSVAIQGNEIHFPAGATTNNVLWVSGAGTGNVITENFFSSVGEGADLTQFWHWSGTWTLSRNLYGGTTTAGNHLDIKLADGLTGNTLTVQENYFDGTNHPVNNYGCAITHNAADLGFSAYTYTVNATGNYFLNCQGTVWDHRISTADAAEIADVDSRTLNFTYNVIHSPVGNLGQVTLQSNHGHFEHNTYVRGTLKLGSGSIDPTDTLVRNNIFYQTTFISHSKIDTCTNNTYYLTTDATAANCSTSLSSNPMFVNVASDWSLQAGSPARDSASDLTNQGAYEDASTPAVDIATNLVLYWPLDTGSGTTAVDTAGGDHSGTFGATTAAPTWLTASSCKFDGCLNFDGVDDVVTFSVPLTTTWTFATWLYQPTAATVTYKPLLYQAAGLALYLQQSGGNTNKLNFYHETDQFSTGVVPRDAWTHIAAVCNVGTLTFYINGTASGTGLCPASFTPTNLGNGAGVNPLSARIDDYRVYTRALSAADISALVAFAPTAGEGEVSVTTFNHTVLLLPAATYGPANEACETPGVGDFTLTTGPTWEGTLESATPGTRYFLNAGTYTTAVLSLPHGTQASPITIKPNNCAAVTINAQIQPGNYTTLAGMTLIHPTATVGSIGTVDLPNPRTGVIVRNNEISSTNHHNLAVAGVQTDLLVQGNEFVMQTGAGAVSNLFIQAPGSNAVFTANKIRNSLSVSQGDDLVRMVNWSGTWTFTRNWFRENLAHDFLDVKYSTVGASSATLNVAENYFHGTALPNGTCFLIHNDSGTGVSGSYSYTVFASGNAFVGCALSLHHRVSQSAGETTDVTTRTLVARYNVFQQSLTTQTSAQVESSNATFEHNTFLLGTFRAGAGGYNPAAFVVRSNIFYQSIFQNASNIDTCSHNDFYQVTLAPTCTSSITTDPVFVNVASDWHLQAGSGALVTGHDATNMGSVISVSLPTVSITQPTSAATYATSATPLTTLQGTATGTSLAGVAWVNSRGGSGTATGTTSWSVASITLQSGENVLTVTVTDGTGQINTDVLTVTYTPPVVIFLPVPGYYTTGFFY